jgi:hypothetical protein
MPQVLSCLKFYHQKSANRPFSGSAGGLDPAHPGIPPGINILEKFTTL